MFLCTYTARLVLYVHCTSCFVRTLHVLFCTYTARLVLYVHCTSCFVRTLHVLFCTCTARLVLYVHCTSCFVRTLHVLFCTYPARLVLYKITVLFSSYVSKKSLTLSPKSLYRILAYSSNKSAVLIFAHPPMS